MANSLQQVQTVKPAKNHGDPSRVPAQAVELNSGSRRLIIDSLSANSAKAVKADLGVYQDWGGTLPGGEHEIANFLSEQLLEYGKRPSTIKRYANSLHLWHQMHGLESPVKGLYVTRVLKGIKRTQDTRPESAPALTPQHLRQLLGSLELNHLRD